VDQFRKIIAEVIAAELPCTLIGGLAVAIRAYPRVTHDVDFVICESDLPRWRSYLTSKGWKSILDRDAFAQWVRETDQGRLDFMVVSAKSYGKILADSELIIVAEIPTRVASAKTLLAMKLHATHYRQSEKQELDWVDVLQLIEPAGYSIESDDFRRMVSLYAAPFAYEEIRRRFRLSRPTDSATGSLCPPSPPYP
jgi:hypothetical protein